jgi:hypothetical protein
MQRRVIAEADNPWGKDRLQTCSILWSITVWRKRRNVSVIKLLSSSRAFALSADPRLETSL